MLGDYTFGNGDKNFLKDTPGAVGQACQTRLLLWLGEWFLNLDEGTPFLQGVLGKHSKEQMDATIKDRALGTAGATSIEDYISEINEDSRSASISFSLNTVFGPTTVQVQNYANF